MKTSKILSLLLASAAFLPIQANANPPTTIQFPMVKSKGAGGTCPFTPSAKVTVHTLGTVENLEVVAKGLPKNTDFVIFNIQVPNAPFGLVWYNGDILTDSNGVGVTNIVGRFNSGTFVFSSAALKSPNTIPSPPGVLPDSKTGAVTNGPVQIYHLGIWFNTPEDATAAGCQGVVPTPFTSNHRAGPQILNTGTFPDDHGPLLDLQ
jgi:hypothetical protein